MTRMTGTLPEDLGTFMVISRWILLRRRNVSSNSCRENQNRFCIQKLCHLHDNVLKCGTARQATDDSIIQRLRFECCTSKVLDTHSEYVFFSPQQQSLCKHASVLSCMYITCLS
jgi:hypothetical protein